MFLSRSVFCILKEQALDLQFSSGRTVEAPIVFIFNVPVKCIQLFPQFWVGELLDVCQYPRFIASEILVKPIIDCREDQLVIVCESNPTGMIDEGSCSRIEQSGSVFRSEGDLFQIWASETGAADRIVQPWVTPDRTQNPMLNVVQRDGFAFDLQQLFIPRPKAEETKADVLDRCHRMMVQNQINGGRVVKIDPEGLLFRAGVL